MGVVCLGVCFNPGVQESFLPRLAAFVRFNPCLRLGIFEFCQVLKAGQILLRVPAALQPRLLSHSLTSS